jgi:hypothetical protein
MTTMSLEVEFAIFGHQVPFLAERHYRKLPRITEKSVPDPIDDVWTALALLVEGHNDGTSRVAMTMMCPKNQHTESIIRVSTFYNRGDWAEDYDFPISGTVMNEMRNGGYVAGTPRWGYTDKTELRLTDRGRRALVEHLNTLP